VEPTLKLKIDSFSGQHRFLSNFYPANVMFDGYTYWTVEHAYQAAKTLDPQQRKWVGMAGTPGQAKARGRKVLIREEWDDIKLDLMLALLRQKFSMRNPDLIHLLIRTAPAELVEGNTWGDRYWGAVDGVGENHLGHLLMQVRSELIVSGA
jgi:N-glycosidase YbiA